MFKKIIIGIVALCVVFALGVKFHLRSKIVCNFKNCFPEKVLIEKDITFPEGYTVSQVFEKIVKNTSITDASLTNTSSLITVPVSTKGAPQSKRLEGWLFPDTYRTDETETAKSLLARMVKNTKDQLTSLKIKKKDWKKTIILASMIEKEAKRNSDRPKVARVFLNRLKLGMRLESDATVSYGTNSTKSVWTTNKQRANKNGHNTYANKGLPIGPICNPGVESIKAAINPAKGNWLYFVVINLKTGETEFNRNKTGHEKSIVKLKKWIAKNN